MNYMNRMIAAIIGLLFLPPVIAQDSPTTDLPIPAIDEITCLQSGTSHRNHGPYGLMIP